MQEGDSERREDRSHPAPQGARTNRRRRCADDDQARRLARLTRDASRLNVQFCTSYGDPNYAHVFVSAAETTDSLPPAMWGRRRGPVLGFLPNLDQTMPGAL